jgi:hypothetical protein
MEYTLKGNRGVFNWFSYFDEEGRITDTLDMSDITFYDALPLQLRPRLAQSGEYTLNLVNSLISHKYKPPRVYQATVMTSTDTFRDQQVYRAVVSFEDNEDVFYFDKEFPHALLWWKAKDGSELALKHSYFTAYWNKTGNEDKRLVE